VIAFAIGTAFGFIMALVGITTGIAISQIKKENSK
jgi:hypothetical protein